MQQHDASVEKLKFFWFTYQENKESFT